MFDAPMPKRQRCSEKVRIGTNDVVRLWSVDAENKLCTTPEFTHQMFDDEVIILDPHVPRNPEINIRWSASALHYNIQVINFEQAEGYIRESINKVLPSHMLYDTGTFESDLKKVEEGFTPLGVLIHSFTKQRRSPLADVSGSTNEISIFEVYLCRGGRDQKALIDYHNLAQKLAYFFIETAEDVSLEDDRWEVYYLYKRKSPVQLHLVGYQTVFHFRNPIQGISSCVCQTLILPWYQRQGHGRRLLRLAHERAIESKSINVVTVENPCFEFSRLRDAVDVESMAKRLITDPDYSNIAALLLSPAGRHYQTTSKKDLQILFGKKKSEITNLATKLKITDAQCRFCLDAIAFYWLEKIDKVQGKKDFRLCIKRRLYMLHRDELGKMLLKADRLCFLQERYRDRQDRCRTVYRVIEQSVRSIQ